MAVVILPVTSGSSAFRSMAMTKPCRFHIPAEAAVPAAPCAARRAQLQPCRITAAGTGKSFVYREISPYVILVSGGQVTVPKLFIENSPPYRVGLVGVWDVVAFDEVAGSQFRRSEEKQIYKDYMEMGSCSRGSGKGTIPAYASFVFNGNIDGDVETRARTSHLFTPFPETIRYDMAFHDRWHAYLPGWELPKMQPEYFTNHLGFIVDYMAEIFRELRKRNYTDAYEHHFRLGNHVEERDRKAIVKTVSGLLKLLHPDGQCAKAERDQKLSFAIEMRRRVKEQLKRMGGIEYAKVNLSYIDLESGEEMFIPCPELGVIQLIPEGQLEPGDVFTVGFDHAEGRFGLFRVQVQATKGSGHLRVTGSTSKPMRDALQTAYDYLRANLRRLGSDRDLKDFDLHVQSQSLMQAKEGSGTGIAFFIAILSAVLARPLVPQLVILGDRLFMVSSCASTRWRINLRLLWMLEPKEGYDPYREQARFRRLAC